MAQAFAALYQPPATTIVVPLPTATSRVRQRGYDQAALLARNYSKLTGLSCLPCLARVGQQHQRGASRQQRLEQLQRAYRVKRRFSLAGASVLLVDDVTTTGASLRAAADTLLRAGATQVSAIVFAQA
ncbi:MAG: phosphoribosyltransferase family protein [Patescibacteria group bacterium]|nr:phosphoribosyltransferase family protein [Patescibacteria group bacterium]